jgi:hypothetical protein
MRPNCLCIASIIALCLVVAGLAIFLGVYLGVFLPLIQREFRDGTCYVQNSTYILSNLDSISNYYIIEVLLSIDDRQYRARTCTSSASVAMTADTAGFGTYPYLYADCEAVGSSYQCSTDELLLPRWFCDSDWNYYDAGTVEDCKWHLYKWDFPVSNDYPDQDIEDYPQANEEFLEVIFDGVIYYNLDDVNALWVVPLGLMTVLPSLFLLCFALPYSLGLCKEKPRFCCLDCLERVFCCRCKYFQPRWLRKYPPPRSAVDVLGPYLRALKQLRAKGLVIPHPVAREITTYFR